MPNPSNFLISSFKGLSGGERYKHNGFTAAHRSLPYGTLLEVTNKANGKKAVVRVNDRGPHRRKVLLDLSYAAAKKIGIVRRGIGNVRVRVLAKKEIPDALYASARN